MNDYTYCPADVNDCLQVTEQPDQESFLQTIHREIRISVFL